jgi:hypothetical protein
VVSVVNILVSFLVGRYEWSAMTLHYNPLTKWAARILVPLYIYITLHINVGMGAFREANYLTARAARKMAKLAEQGVVPAPFQTDGFLAPWSYTGDFGFTSWMTLVLGICFALFALIKGAHADDKFPTYSKKFRACKYKQEEVWQAIETYQQAHEGDVKEFRGEMEHFLPAAISQIDQWGKFTNTAQRRFVDYEQWIPKLETVYRECWTTYVGAHEKSRLSDYQVPEIFSMPLERLFEGENMEPSYIFSDVADIVMPDTEREGKMAKFKSDCRSIFEEEYKAGDEKITQLDEILKKRVAAGECHL